MIMRITIRVDSDYHGPSILEMESLLEVSNDPQTVTWGNSKAEVCLLTRYHACTLELVVPDLPSMERAANTLGIAYKLPAELVTKAYENIIKLNGMWHDFNQQVGQGLARATLIRMVNENIKRGNDPKELRKVLVDALFEDLGTTDIDVLLGLRLTGIVV